MERELAAGRIDAAVELMSAHERDDFPPHWDPSPRAAYGQLTPLVTDVLLASRGDRAVDWVYALYLRKAEDQFARLHSVEFYLRELSVEQAERFATAFETIPELRQAITDEGLGHLGGIRPDELRWGHTAVEAERMVDVLNRLAAAARSDHSDSATAVEPGSERSRTDSDGGPADSAAPPSAVDPTLPQETSPP